MKPGSPEPRGSGRDDAGDPGHLPPAPTSTDTAIEHLFRLLVDHVAEYAILLLDAEGHVRSWNPGAQRINGYESREILGCHFSIFYPEAERQAGKPDSELMIASKEGHFEEEGWRVRKDGSRFWANVLITALRDDSGTLLGFAKIVRDQTDRIAAERRAIEDATNLARQETARRLAEERASELSELLVRLNEQATELEARRLEAERANRVKSTFLAAISHELRTPLNAIGGYVDLILLGVRGPVAEAQRQDLLRVWKSQRRLLGLINDLLSFARIEAGHLEYDLEPVSIRHAVLSSIEVIEPELTLKRHKLIKSLPDDRLTVMADPDRLEQILLNLLSNAVKFTPGGGRISTRATLANNKVRVTVADNGPGIPAERIQEIFKPFTQIRGDEMRIEGTGLGLAIARELAWGMGGTLEAQSQIGVGSTFVLELPLATPSLSSSGETAARATT